MNKITKKLFLYFSIVSIFLSIIVFVGFYGTFRYYSLQHQEEELHQRAEIIRERLEEYINTCAQNQELGAYINVLDDISQANAYFLTEDGKDYTCGCSCGTTVSTDKKSTKEVETFSKEIFSSGMFAQKEIFKNGKTKIYAGIPVKDGDKTNAVVVIVDTFELDQKSFFMAIGTLLLCIVVALVIAVVLASALAKHFMAPIHKIAMATKKLAAGDYHVVTEVTDENEIGVLAKEVDVLATKLASVEQMQNDYVTSVSHELRTPVTVIRSSVEALCDGIVPKEKYEEYHKQILAETISLQRLVNDMLELSRLENEEFKIEKQGIDLLQVLEDAIRAVRLMANKKELVIECEELSTEWPMNGDYGRLKQMFITVLDNAVKYSEKGGKIRVNAKKKGDNYYIAVQDEGCGIPEEKQKYIFDKFFRSSEAGGTGMGLVVMKSIAKRHDIEVRMNSQEGKGTKFTFIVPIYKYNEKNDK